MPGTTRQPTDGRRRAGAALASGKALAGAADARARAPGRGAATGNARAPAADRDAAAGRRAAGATRATGSGAGAAVAPVQPGGERQAAEQRLARRRGARAVARAGRGRQLPRVLAAPPGRVRVLRAPPAALAPAA